MLAAFTRRVQRGRLRSERLAGRQRPRTRRPGSLRSIRMTALPGSEMRNLKLLIRPTLKRLLLIVKRDTRGREASRAGGGGGAGGTEKSWIGAASLVPLVEAR